MQYIDGETGLPLDIAEKVKEKIAQLRAENQQLRERIALLEQENTLLREKIQLMEDGGLGVKKVSDRIEFIPKDTSIAQLTSDGYLKPISPNLLVLGDADNYLNDVITANITVSSLGAVKRDVSELSDDVLTITFPRPKRYRRQEGRGDEWEIGLLAEELPQILRRGNGYDLKAIVSVIAYKITKLEQRLSKLTTRP